MSQPMHPSSQAAQAEIQELINEISFQKVLLSSIDDSVQNREAAEDEVKEEIRQLEAQLRALRRSTTTTASQLTSSQQSQFSLSAQAPSSIPSKSKKPAQPTLEDDSTLTSVVDSSIIPSQWNSSASSMPSTPKSADSFKELISPNQMSLPSRKRSHSKHLDGALYPPQETKSRRTSPSPYMAGPGTPSSIMSSGDEELEEFGNQMAIEQQKLAEERIRQVRLDEEFARNIQNGSYAPPSASSSSTQPNTQYNAFGRMSGMRPPPTAGVSSLNPQAGESSSRKLPWNTNIKAEPALKAEPRSMTSGVKREEPSNMAAGFSTYATMNINRPGIKSEASSSRAMPGTFPDDSSAASDSDIEIIPSSAFHANGRYSRPTGAYQPQESVKRSPESIAAGNAALQRMGQTATGDALQMALFGGLRKQPDWTNGAPGSSQNPFTGKSEFVYPTNLHTPAPGQGYTMSNLPVYGGGLANPSSAFGQPAPFFDPLDDLISHAGNNFDEISRHLNLDPSMNGTLDYIMNDPRKTNQEIKNLLENIRPDEDLPPENREGTPDGLVYPLYEHQKIALTWMKSMEEGSSRGGILADDMGLGKTISALALMLSRRSTDPLCKTTLIVGPVALVRQWEREIRVKITPNHRLSTYLMHGKGRKTSWDDLRTYDVVLTTYGTLGSEYRQIIKYLEERKNQEYDQAPMRKLFPLLGPKSVFFRVLLDEAQCIKNRGVQAAKAACQLDSKYRFCLTGTPMMNNVGELYSLIHFLRIKPYNEWSKFNTEFGMLTKEKRGYDLDKAMRKLQTVLKAILLRRTKTSLIDGKPIITLHPKTEEIQHVVFDEAEQDFYTALETKTQIKFSRYLKAGTVNKNYSNVLVLLLRLRQACCHPHLIQDFDEAPMVGGPNAEDMMEFARSLAPDVVARLLAAEDAFDCPVCYDGVENPRIIIPCGHDTCSECLAKIADSAAQQHVAEGEEGAATCKCPTCRGVLNMSKVIDYGTFKKVHKPDAVAADDDNDLTDSEDSDSDEIDDDSDSESEQDINSDGDLRGFIVPDDISDTDGIDDDPTEDEEADDEAEDISKRSKGKGKAVAKSRSKSKSKTKSKRPKKDKKGKQKEKSTHISIAMLKKEGNKSKAGRKRYMKHLKKHWQPSAKVTKCVELLERFQEEQQKTIVFSQFVSLLDLLSVPINEKNFKFLRYDGGMSADERNDAVVSFTDSKDYNIMLISLKAGNAGLNLVAASRVIILDPFWNPYIEMQAVDRAYRIGQQREVQVHRILIEKTVEDRIIALQEKKRRLVESALDEGANREVGRLGVQQLAFLFGVPA
ncbi:uncharacterized protein LY89DRAFT_711734 [Mollisia scopiformis]|uniref:Uncharacterized protein n=1 Tax=Mollisia scopiformis TaxID=149040 RepID=A0A132B7G3_MOLSC|nr:uncharacterized protein LY89DRAFT_711734 [Mollisia scopiformis]KUJ08350.1 hypothetical protein LY89DRAFT_711734 [Mollisia scopiformis]